MKIKDYSPTSAFLGPRRPPAWNELWATRTPASLRLPVSQRDRQHPIDGLGQISPLPYYFPRLFSCSHLAAASITLGMGCLPLP
jgi:hypothetical protein